MKIANNVSYTRTSKYRSQINTYSNLKPNSFHSRINGKMDSMKIMPPIIAIVITVIIAAPLRYRREQCNKLNSTIHSILINCVCCLHTFFHFQYKMNCLLFFKRYFSLLFFFCVCVYHDDSSMTMTMTTTLDDAIKYHCHRNTADECAKISFSQQWYKINSIRCLSLSVADAVFFNRALHSAFYYQFYTVANVQ